MKKLLISITISTVTANVHADSFGSGGNAFTIDFVNVGNAGNGDEGFSPRGGVAYSYRIGATEAAQEWITKATNLGLTNVATGPWTGSQPATNVTWYEQAAFVNWLNTSTGHQAAYDLTWTGSEWTMNLWSSAASWDDDPSIGVNLNPFRHKDAYYFLPSTDEWYKAAYHKNDGATANYWDYPIGSDTAPTAVTGGTGAGTAVSKPASSSPATVFNNGGLSPYGTRGQGGNVWETLEGAFDGVNDSSSESRMSRGGSWATSVNLAFAGNSGGVQVTVSQSDIGFRVASAAVPEPSSMLLIGSGIMFLVRRRRII